MITEFKNYIKEQLVHSEIDPYNEEDWNIYGPLENLKYGADGPKFKCGHRVKCVLTPKLQDIINRQAIKGEFNGTVVDYNYKIDAYLIGFDEDVLAKGGDYFLEVYNIPNGHALYIKEYLIRLL